MACYEPKFKRVATDAARLRSRHFGSWAKAIVVMNDDDKINSDPSNKIKSNLSIIKSSCVDNLTNQKSSASSEGEGFEGSGRNFC